MRERFSGKLGRGLFFAAVIFLVYTAGAMMTVAGIFPSAYFRNAYTAATALYEKETQYQDPLATDLWKVARTPEIGTTVWNRDKAYPGLTLYTSGDGDKAVLIDMAGRVVHQWRRPYSTVWDRSAAVRNPVPDSQTYLDMARLFPNGDLLAIYIGAGDTPYGYGMVKLDRNSKVIWKNLDHFHHDFMIAEDGKIYALAQDFRFRPVPGVIHLGKPLLDDYLVILSPDGKTLKRISLLDAVNRSAYRRLLWLAPYYSLGDPLHTNMVRVLEKDTSAGFARKVPAATPGRVFLSFRELAGGTIALLDVDEDKIVWALRGPWLSQHDPEILANGDILMFDNRGHYGPGGESRVLEIDPGTGSIVWQYAGDARHRLQSMIRSSVQRLPNGDTLIDESDGGRLMEVTPEGETVWEYYNPDRTRHNGAKLTAVVSSGERIEAAALATDFRREIDTKRLSKGG